MSKHFVFINCFSTVTHETSLVTGVSWLIQMEYKSCEYQSEQPNSKSISMITVSLNLSIVACCDVVRSSFLEISELPTPTVSCFTPSMRHCKIMITYIKAVGEGPTTPKNPVQS